ncbi:glycoside hydrolase family 3 protein [Amanita muscaria Koide BX008]|uniref:Glycoside hydrolase family 3 protein n=1 Tax=Amanita muscaria (strain Koide BX008) TaxID=946122 RepID=A0A0C2WIK1_AMAMK|nr:glycoside hydrolase family 3 protein [Amanita muscaria Koide BX008]
MVSFLNDEARRLIGQCFVFGFNGYELSNDIKTLIRDYHLGNVILMKRNVKDALQVRRLVQALQTFTRQCGHERPLLIGTDQENGLVSAFSSPTAGTQFPGAMAIAATGSTELAEKVAAATGLELKLVGINWAYSPVADVNSNPRNPVIGVRSFGDDPTKVASFACAVSNGLTSTGVAPCAKHFPGHGDTHIDSHLTLPRIMKDKQALLSTELVPFNALVNSDVASVMTGHMALPLLTGDDTPSSLSATVVKDLLRREMGFEGVIVTDCLEMAAIAEPEQGGCGVEEGAVRSLEAGADVVMICHTMERQVGAIKSVYEAVDAGRLKLDDLREAHRRISTMKTIFAGGWDKAIDTNEAAFAYAWKALKKTNAALSQDAYKRSVTLVWDHGLVLPLKKTGLVLLFTPRIESVNKAVDDPETLARTADGDIRNKAGPSYMAFAEAIRAQSSVEHVIYGPDDTVGAVQEPSAIAFVLRNAERAAWQQRTLMNVLNKRKNIPLVVISSCGPYDLVGLDVGTADCTCYIQTFEFTTAGLESAAELLF